MKLSTTKSDEIRKSALRVLQVYLQMNTDELGRRGDALDDAMAELADSFEYECLRDASGKWYRRWQRTGATS